MLAPIVVLACLVVAVPPSAADLLCLDAAGNFVPCGRTDTSLPSRPSDIVPPSSRDVAPPSTGMARSAGPVGGPQSAGPAARPRLSGPAVHKGPLSRATASAQVGLPDLDHALVRPAGPRGRGLAVPIAVIDAVVVVLLGAAAFERRRVLRLASDVARAPTKRAIR
jgi:hypothetical protein